MRFADETAFERAGAAKTARGLCIRASAPQSARPCAACGEASGREANERNHSAESRTPDAPTDTEKEDTCAPCVFLVTRNTQRRNAQRRMVSNGSTNHVLGGDGCEPRVSFLVSHSACTCRACGSETLDISRVLPCVAHCSREGITGCLVSAASLKAPQTNSRALTPRGPEYCCHPWCGFRPRCRVLCQTLACRPKESSKCGTAALSW